jgi:predicted transposase
MFVTLRFKVIPQSKKDYEEISKLMRLYGSTVRYAYNRFLDGYSKNEVYHLVRQTFKDLPSWYVESAIGEALEILRSVKSKGENPRKDVSLLKPILIQGKWEKVVSRLDSFCLGEAGIIT